MTPKKLTLQGSLGILAGLNRDEITMNLSAMIPDDAVTVALIGDNGSGKSTLFNLAFTPWRDPVMLSGTIYDEFGDTGLRELEFTHNERRYKSRIEIRQTARTKTQRAYLHLWDDIGIGAWIPVTLSDNTVSDGKTLTYDACIEHILGPRNLYYLSAFRAQNAPKLAEYDDPKGLMQALLALDEPQELRNKSKLVKRELRREYESVRHDCERLKDKAATINNLTLQVSTYENDIPALLQAKTAAVEAVALAKAEFEKATGDEAGNIKIRQQRELVEKRLGDRRTQLYSDINAVDSDISTVHIRLQTEKVESADRTKKNKQRIQSVTFRKQDAEGLLLRREEIVRAAKEAKRLADSIPSHEIAVDDLRQQVTRIQELAKEMQTQQVKVRSAANSKKLLSDRCIDLETQAGFVDRVPCNGMAPYDTCPALISAIQATSLIPDAKTRVEEKAGEWAALEAGLQSLKGLLDELPPLNEGQFSLTTQKNTLANIRTRLDSLRQTAALASGMEQAQKTVDGARNELFNLDAEQKSARNADEKRMADIELQLTSLTERATRIRTEADIAIHAIQAELDALPEPTSDGRQEAARKVLESAETEQNDAARNVDQKNADIAEAHARSKTLQAEIDEGDSIRRRADYLADEIAHWHLLSIALQGVIDLSIEDAGPAISSTANHLLTEAYGPRFTVNIVTQREQANGKLVECFDIFVIDSESGLESSILKKSGGELVWLDKALTDSVGIYHQDAAGINYECLFADESEDGLTQDRKNQFYRMDRAALKIGGYQRKYFVSHNPEAWAMADAVIDLAEWRMTG